MVLAGVDPRLVNMACNKSQDLSILMSVPSQTDQSRVSGELSPDARALERDSLGQIGWFGKWIFVGTVIVAIEFVFAPHPPSAILEQYCSGPLAPPWCRGVEGEVASSGTYVSLILATGAIFQLVATLCATRGYGMMSKVDSTFRNCARLSMVAVAGISVIVIEMVYLTLAPSSVSGAVLSGIPIVFAILLVGLAPAFVGFVGIIYGIVKLGDKYDAGNLGAAAAALLLGPVLSAVVPLVGPLVVIYGLYKLINGTGKAMR